MLKFYISYICNYLYMYTKDKILSKYHIYKSRGEKGLYEERESAGEA